MALRKSLMIAVSAASLLASTAAFAQQDAAMDAGAGATTTQDASDAGQNVGATKTAGSHTKQHHAKGAHKGAKKGTHKKGAHKHAKKADAAAPAADAPAAQ